MSRASVRSKILFVCCLSLALSGCYSGWNGPKDRDKNPGNDKPGPGGGGGGGAKIFGVVVLDVVRPSLSAMQSTTCSTIPSSLVELRTWEIEQRIRAMEDALTAIAETTKTVITEVKPEDCAKMSVVNARTLDKHESIVLTSAQKLKPAAHVRLAIWFNTQPYVFPSYELTDYEWEFEKRLKKEGVLKVLDVNHFATTTTAHGFFSFWRSWTAADSFHLATMIDQPAPTQEGMQLQTEAIQKSTIEFSQWLTTRASGQ